MKDRNFVKEIEKLRTAVLGYDREEVVLYIKELVDYYEKKNEDAVKELYLEKMRLTTENSGLRSQVSTQEKIYAELAARMDRINQSVEKREESARAIVNNANIEKERILSDAGLERRKILKEADEKQKEILAEAGRQMDVILVKTREKVEKEQALYYQYRNRLQVLKNGLDNIFAECPPEKNIPNPQKQPEQPVMQEKQASAEQQEQSSGDSGQIQTGDMEEIQIEEINLQEQP
mgnify:FL=1